MVRIGFWSTGSSASERVTARCRVLPIAPSTERLMGCHAPGRLGRPLSMQEPAASLLVLGLGNDILTDDAVGLLAVREAGRRLAGAPGVDFRETTEMGLALLDFVTGYRDLILVDSIQTGRATPGSIHEIGAEDLATFSRPTPHFVGLGETLALGRRLGMAMPGRVRVYAIEVADPFTLGTELTPSVREAVDAVVERVGQTVAEWQGRVR